jgi:hypothetical protein
MEEPPVQGLRPGDVLPVAHLEPEVTEAALQLQDCVGAIVEGRHVAAAADPDAFRAHRSWDRSSGSPLSSEELALKGTAQLVTVGALPFLHIHAPCHDLSTFFPSLQPHLKTFVAPVLIGDFNYVLRWKSIITLVKGCFYLSSAPGWPATSPPTQIIMSLQFSKRAPRQTREITVRFP